MSLSANFSQFKYYQNIFTMNINQKQPELLTLFHFNDVYNIQPYSKQPKAGAAYFNSLLQRQKKKYQQIVTLFSGDAFSPSLLSTQFEGQNMIKPLNAFGIDIACYGNHDLDYEINQVIKLVKQTNFPWLLSNVYDKRTCRRLCQGLQTYIIHKNGIKIGIFSLAEKQWIDTLYPYYKQICEYIPFIEFATKMVQQLRVEEKCDMVIALTHMMKYNDIKLAKQVAGIDLILGGHDHLITQEKVNDSVLIKSGTDFRNFSIIKIQRNSNQPQQSSAQLLPNTLFLKNSLWTFEIQVKEVNHQIQNIIPDPELDHYVQQIYKQFKQKQERVACFTLKQIDLRFTTMRKQQSPFLQFLVSVYRHQSGSDIAICNSGNFRMDTLIKPGPITFGVIQNIILDKIVAKLIPGNILIQALQNCVSMYPNLAGRYSAYSGIGFTWDASQPPGKRVLVDTIRIHDKKIDLQRIYKVAVHSFTADGGDGFTCFTQCQTIESDGDRYNRQLLHDLLHINRFLLDSYIVKYPGRFNIIEKDGNSYLELNLPDPKNVHMIVSTGHVYETH